MRIKSGLLERTRPGLHSASHPSQHHTHTVGHYRIWFQLCWMNGMDCSIGIAVFLCFKCYFSLRLSACHRISITSGSCVSKTKHWGSLSESVYSWKGHPPGENLISPSGSVQQYKVWVLTAKLFPAQSCSEWTPELGTMAGSTAKHSRS